MVLKTTLAALVLLVATATACGRAESLVPLHAAWPGSQATGSLMVRDLPICSATLVASDVVVTSARCARAALGNGAVFRWRHGTTQFDTPVVDGYGLDANGALSTERWTPRASPSQRAAARSIRRHCNVHDLFALHRSEATRLCLDGLQPALLRAAGALGLAAWHDIGWLGLQDAVPTVPAQPAPADASASLQNDADLRRIGVYRVVGLRESPLQRYEHDYHLYEVDGAELHAGPRAGRIHDDIGSGLWVQTYVDGTLVWQLVGVGSRPFVAHGDTSAGIIFSRLDRNAGAMREALQRLHAASPH